MGGDGGTGRLGDWECGEMGRWGVGGVWGVGGDGEMGRWGDGEMGRWGDGEWGEMGRYINSELRTHIFSFPFVSIIKLARCLRKSISEGVSKR